MLNSGKAFDGAKAFDVVIGNKRKGLLLRNHDGKALRAGHAQYVCADLRDKAQVVRGEWMSTSAGVAFIPHVIYVSPGEVVNQFQTAICFHTTKPLMYIDRETEWSF